MDTNIPGALEQALEAMSHQELLALILKLTGERADFRRALLANVSISPQIINQQPRKAQQVKKLKQEITNFFNELQDRSQYGDDYYDHEYHEDEEYPELDSLFEIAKTLNPGDQIEVFWHVLTCGNDMFEEYPIGTAQIREATGLYAEAVGKLKLAPQDKQSYFDSLIGALSWNMCDYGEVIQAIKNALDTMCTAPADYLYLISKFKKSDHPKANDWVAGYYLKLGDEKNYLQIRQENLQAEAQYMELAEYWQKKGEQKKYVATLEKWVANLPRKKSEPQFHYSAYDSTEESDIVLKALAEHYRKQKDDENLCRILLTMAKYDEVTLDLYKQIEKVSAKLGKWQKLQPTLVELAKEDVETLAEIYLYEKDWQTAIQLAHQKTSYERVRVSVAEGVKKHHPEESIKIYQKLVQHYIDLKSRKHYHRAARYAAEIKSVYLSILNNKDAWQRYVDLLRKRYLRYPALQDEFRRL